MFLTDLDDESYSQFINAEILKPLELLFTSSNRSNESGIHVPIAELVDNLFNVLLGLPTWLFPWNNVRIVSLACFHLN